jgi:glutamine amidotransferase
MITIVDYGSGNLRSVQKAFERLGAAARVTSDPGVVGDAQRLVLPGVGAFGDAMRELHSRGLVAPIIDHLRADRPFFGICMDLPPDLKVPHMGWNTVAWRGPARSGTDADHYYFVHSYHARPADTAVVAAVTDYGGEFCSAVSRGRLFATQFHPEKSQAAGMRLLRSFLQAD